MTDIERIIREYEKRIEYFSHLENVERYTRHMEGDERRAFRQDREDDNLILSALQEREERSKPLAWRKYSYDEWICPHCGYDKYCDTLDGGVLPPFCEECGRPLKGADHE